jgi:hypothetical protein
VPQRDSAIGDEMMRFLVFVVGSQWFVNGWGKMKPALFSPVIHVKYILFMQITSKIRSAIFGM